MFYSDEGANYLVQYAKSMVDEIAKNKKIPNDFISEQYLIFAGMLAYYGFDHVQEIYDVFKKTAFVSNTGPVETCSNGAFSPAYCQTEAVPLPGNKFSIKKTIYHTHFRGENYGHFVEVLCHEINHCINSIRHPFCRRNSLPVYRNGINVSYLDSGKEEAKYLEEAINTIQTGEIMKKIMMLGDYNIKDPTVRSSIRSLANYKVGDLGLGYQTITPIVYPLYCDSEFNYLIKEERISANIRDITDNFDSRVGRDSFYELAEAVDDAWQNRNVSQAKRAYQLVRQYHR